jgi:hypothetical protein
MLEETPTTGSIYTTFHERKRLAQESHNFNASDRVFKKLFPHLIKKSNIPSQSAVNGERTKEDEFTNFYEEGGVRKRNQKKGRPNVGTRQVDPPLPEMESDTKYIKRSTPTDHLIILCGLVVVVLIFFMHYYLFGHLNPFSFDFLD